MDLKNYTFRFTALVTQRGIRVWLVMAGGILLLAGSFLAIAATYTARFTGTVYPGVIIGTYQVGGLRPAEVAELLSRLEKRYKQEGLTLAIDPNDPDYSNQRVSVFFSAATSSRAIFDIDEAVKNAYTAGREGSVITRLAQPLVFRLSPRPVKLSLGVSTADLESAVAAATARYTDKVENPTVHIIRFHPFDFTVTSEKTGRMFDTRSIAVAAREAVGQLSFSPIPARRAQFAPSVSRHEVVAATNQLPGLFAAGPIVLEWKPTTTTAFSWSVSPEDFSRWIEPVRNNEGAVIFALKAENVIPFLNQIVQPEIISTSRNAVFRREGTKIVEFDPGADGRELNIKETYRRLNAALMERARLATTTPPVAIAVDVVAPDITLAEANDLGIGGILGIGISTFRDSHTNRIKNIANAVKRLNGYLVPPGEEFSANKAAGPYTRANGFLPEMVIKGREIKPEVGGGMCQIGTTLFRMAMNSGMDITERRNHSLVVSYYADPVNGNPGTDATLYEPILDFKFMNDTGNYLLIQTEVDFKKQQLIFTLWGKPDGRSGLYTHPLVSRWIPAGAPQDIPSDTLPPGQKKCQNAFRGAVASFTYTRIAPDGSKIERVFDSYYRPLPRICLVGKEATPTCPEGESCTPSELAPLPGPGEPIEPVPEPVEAP